MRDILVRDVTEVALPSIVEIYNHAIDNTTTIIAETRVNLEDYLKW